MEFTNSPLVSFTKISPNKTTRTHAIDTITIHCVVGQVSVERLGSIFAPTTKYASSNYGVGYDGRIGMYVEEKDRSWCSSNAENDNRAITIEVASDSTYPYAVTAEAYAGLLDLVTDICKRNGIQKLVWSTNKNDRVNHLNGCNMTVHRDYANKSCPGDYLYNLHGNIAEEVNRRLGVSDVQPVAGNDDEAIKAGDIVKIIGTKYYTGAVVPGWVLAKKWVVHSVSGDRVVLDKSEDGENSIMSPFYISDIALAYKDAKDDNIAVSGTVSTGSEEDMKRFRDFFMEQIGNAFGVAGLWGNIYAESAGRSNNLQNSYEKKLGYTDETYTDAVDNGSYTNFINDGAGYGLAQWTFFTRKRDLIEYARSVEKSIGDYEMQLAFLSKELSCYPGVLDVLKTATSVKEASDTVMMEFERPADTGDAAKESRLKHGLSFFEKFFDTKDGGIEDEQAEGKKKCTAEMVIAVAVNELGYHEKASNADLDNKTANIGDRNFTKYARDFDVVYPQWYNGKKNGFAWCDMFVDWCHLTAFGYEKALQLLCQPEHSTGAGCVYSLRYYKMKDQFHSRDPKPGDQIFFGESIDIVHHTGLVEDVDDQYVYTIEGNTSDMVARRKYALNDGSIVGYGRPNYDAVDAPDDIPEAKPEPAEDEPSYGYVLRTGSSGERVKDMQQKLETLGYGVVADFGDSTRATVLEFQSDNGLLVDGEAGDQTLGKIDELIAAKE